MEFNKIKQGDLLYKYDYLWRDEVSCYQVIRRTEKQLRITKVYADQSKFPIEYRVNSGEFSKFFMSKLDAMKDKLVRMEYELEALTEEVKETVAKRTLLVNEIKKLEVK